MTKQKSVILSLILIFLTFFIFLFTFILSKFFILESKAKTPVPDSALVSKSMELDYKSNMDIRKTFLSKSKHKVVYLTFDDGPTAYTKDILNTLKKFDAGATFFVLGPRAKASSKIIKQMVKEGHSIGCHGTSHQKKSFYKNVDSPKKEMNSCAKTVKEAADYKVKLVRTPYGSYPYLTKKQKKQLEKAGYIIWDWNVDSRDWTKPSSKKLVNSVINQVKTQSKKGHTPVILFHDTKLTAETLPKILKELEKMGYVFKPLNEKEIPVQF